MEQRETIWSVSLIPYHSHLGYLFCNESRTNKRTGKTQVQTHPIGGKVEASDRDPLFTAIREFVEETRIDVISQRYEAIYADLESQMRTPMRSAWSAATLCSPWEPTELASIAWFDYVVGRESLFDEATQREYIHTKIHRFYVWDITSVDPWIVHCIVHLPSLFSELPREMKGKVRFLYWITHHEVHRIRNRTPLVDAFFSVSPF